jgi:hypothetical protein
MPIDGDGDDSAPSRDGGDRPALALAAPRTGPSPKRRSSNATSVSTTDPDAKLRGKPGQRPHLVHRGQIAIDPQARCVVACLGERATGHEGDALVPIIQRARFACPELVSVGADQGFAGERVWSDVTALGVIAFVSPQRTMLPEAEPKTSAQAAAVKARRRCKTPKGIWAYERRMCDAEGGVAELKNEHGMDRARCRGTSLFHVQLLLASSALNLKRLAARDLAAEGTAAGPAKAKITALDTSSQAAEDASTAATVQPAATAAPRPRGRSPSQ